MNVEKKLESFKDIALSEALMQKSRILTEIDLEYKNACELFQKNASALAGKKLSAEAQEAESQKNKEILNALTEERKVLTELRARQISNIFSAVAERLKAYVETDEYLNRMLDEILNVCKGKSGAVVYLCERDYKRLNKKVFEKNITLKISDTDFLGGFKMRCGPNIQIDNTYETKIENERRNANYFKIE